MHKHVTSSAFMELHVVVSCTFPLVKNILFRLCQEMNLGLIHFHFSFGPVMRVVYLLNLFKKLGYKLLQFLVCGQVELVI